MDIPTENKEILSKIATFKLELQKFDVFTAEDKLVILKSFAASIFDAPVGPGATATPLSEPVNHKGRDSNRGDARFQTFAEMVRVTKFKQHPDLILLATYYLIIMNKMDSVCTTDIEQQYSSAMIKASSNTNANINVNRKKGYMMETEKKDGRMYFKITMSGVDYLEGIIESIQQ